MARDPAPLRLDHPDVLRSYDTRSIERGLRYAAEGRVDVVDVGADWATAEVMGNAAAPYEVHVDWAGLDARRGLTDTCSCPLGGDCKHAVALIVEVSQLDAAPTTASTARLRDRSWPARPPSFGRGAPTRLPTWRDALADVAVSDTPEARPLALQFTFHTARPTSYAPDPSVQVLVRPMRMGAKGRWVKSGAGWREVVGGYGWDLGDADPAHLGALRGLGAGNNAFAYSSGNGPVAFDRLGPTAWTGLRAAADAGVALVDEHGRELVALSERTARTVVDLTSAPDGGVHVRVAVSIDDQVVDLPSPTTGLVGTPPHGLWRRDGDRVELVPMDRPVHAGIATLVGAAPLLVPAGDVDELLDDYQPQLAKIAAVGSSDGSITIEQTRLDGLVAQVEHHDVASARLRWAARTAAASASRSTRSPPPADRVATGRPNARWWARSSCPPTCCPSSSDRSGELWTSR